MIYDSRGRIDNLNTVFGSASFNTAYEYNDKTIRTIYDGAGGGMNRLSNYRTTDDAGYFVSKVDALGDTVKATYYHSGQVHTMNSVTFEYDSIGRKTKMIDPDAGTIQYTYNVFGGLTDEIHDSISMKRLVYDDFGRIDSAYYYKYAGGDVS